MTKNVSMNKLFFCFRPAVEYMENQKLSLTRSSSDGGSSRSSPPPKTTLSRTAKAIVFGKILIKRVRERRSYHNQNSHQWKRSLSLNSDELVNSGVVGIDQENKANSSFQLSKSKSLNSSIGASISTKRGKKNRGSTAVKRRNAGDRSRCAFNSGVGLLVISLVITVIWGRVYAIFLTSIWVYFFAWIQIENRLLKKKAKIISRNRGYGQQEEFLS